jgi:hypothetical protein
MRTCLLPVRPPLVTTLALALGACSPGASPDASPDARGDAAIDSDGVDASGPAVDAAAPTDGGCGYQNRGTVLHVADQIDLCLPPVVCTSETCPPALGTCVAGVCQHSPGYAALLTTPQVWSTYYCTLSTGGCHGVTQIEYPEVTAMRIATALALPLCEGAAGSGRCVGIAASNPLVVGNSQEARDPSTGQLVGAWGLGMTEASGLCYELTGPGGTAVVALTDRCGGYCRCNGSGFQECGPCVNAPDMQPNCACVGAVPGLYTQCCGNGCATTQQDCDWCASNTHAHFDLDTGAFNHVCGAAASAGSCRITSARFVPCLAAQSAWPPGGGGATCRTGSFQCSGPMPHQVQVPGTSCCCNYDLLPQPDGTCR